MAKTLQEILTPEVIRSIVSRMRPIVVHRLENVDGDPTRIRSACGYHSWIRKRRMTLIDDSKRIHAVTCSKCLATMSDQPIVVEVK